MSFLSKLTIMTGKQQPKVEEPKKEEMKQPEIMTSLKKLNDKEQEQQDRKQTINQFIDKCNDKEDKTKKKELVEELKIILNQFYNEIDEDLIF